MYLVSVLPLVSCLFLAFCFPDIIILVSRVSAFLFCFNGLVIPTLFYLKINRKRRWSTCKYVAGVLFLVVSIVLPFVSLFGTV